MYDNIGNQPGGTRLPSNGQQIPFGSAFSGAGSGLIRGGLGAYGEKILGSSSEYVQSNVSCVLGLRALFKLHYRWGKLIYAYVTAKSNCLLIAFVFSHLIYLGCKVLYETEIRFLFVY